MIRVVNLILFIFGGIGMVDYLYKVLIRELIWLILYDGVIVFVNFLIMIVLNILGFVVIGIFVLVIILVLVYIGEKRIDYYCKKNKNYKLLVVNLVDGRIKI